MSLAAKLADIARAEVGVREEGGNNRGARIVEYQKATWLEPGPWPWCAAFTAWVLREWLSLPGVHDALGGVDPEAWRCKDARAYGWEEWAQKRGLLLLDESMPAEPGDFVTFDFSHIGIVVEDHGSSILTIEGNTSAKGGRDSESGDGVWRMVRLRPLVRRFIRVLA